MKKTWNIARNNLTIYEKRLLEFITLLSSLTWLISSFQFDLLFLNFRFNLHLNATELLKCYTVSNFSHWIKLIVNAYRSNQHFLLIPFVNEWIFKMKQKHIRLGQKSAKINKTDKNIWFMKKCEIWNFQLR